MPECTSPRDEIKAGEPMDLDQFEGHTPEPWTAWKTTFSGPDGMIGEVGFGKRDDAEMLANARLVAASPRLLAELRRTRQWISDLQTPGSHTTMTHGDVRRLLEQAEIKAGDPAAGVDPRGPERLIMSVAVDPEGGLTRVTLDCSHVARLNQAFTYQVGTRCRCLACLGPTIRSLAAIRDDIAEVLEHSNPTRPDYCTDVELEQLERRQEGIAAAEARALAADAMAAVCLSLDDFGKPCLPTARDWENAAVGDELASIVKEARGALRKAGEPR